MGTVWFIFLLIFSFVIGLLAGRLLKMNFGCTKEGTADGAEYSALHSKSDSVSNDIASAEAAPAMTTSKAENEGSPEPAKSEMEKDAERKQTAPKKLTKATSKKPAEKSAAKAASSPKKVVAATEGDKLQRIKGVGKLAEQRLNEDGITSFAQIAAWKKSDIAKFDEKLNFKGRIEREEWVAQAKVLAKEATSASSSSETKKTSATKSTTAKKPANSAAKKAAAVKKSAATKPASATAKNASAASKSAATKKAPARKAASKTKDMKAAPDDLKMIKGVGKLLETKLASEGITTFAQIAAWKKADIAEFDERLNFKGRIEREDWVSQAKVLAKGGATEFSKRAEKGDVPTSSD